MCKICKRLTANRITNHLLENKVLDPRHLGFQLFLDRLLLLCMFHLDINHAKKEKKFLLGISLDLQAEYDSVYIDGVHRSELLAHFSFGSNVFSFAAALRWSEGWNWGRLSSARATGRGVPQAVVLSPILFTIFLSDFFKSWKACMSSTWSMQMIYSSITLIHHWKHSRLNYKRLSVWLLSCAYTESCPSTQINVTLLICLEELLSENLTAVLTVASLNGAFKLNFSGFVWFDAGVSETCSISEKKIV